MELFLLDFACATVSPAGRTASGVHPPGSFLGFFGFLAHLVRGPLLMNEAGREFVRFARFARTGVVCRVTGLCGRREAARRLTDEQLGDEQAGWVAAAVSEHTFAAKSAAEFARLMRFIRRGREEATGM